MQNIGLVELAIKDFSRVEARDELRKLGISRLSAMPTLLIDLSNPGSDKQLLQERIFWHGSDVEIVSIQGFFFGSRPGLLCASSFLPEATLLFHDAVRAAVGLGAHQVIVGAPAQRIGSTPSSRAAFKSTMTVLNQIAEAAGLQLLLENLPRGDEPMVAASPFDIMELQELGVGLCLDLGNFRSYFKSDEAFLESVSSDCHDIISHSAQVQINLDVISEEVSRHLLSLSVLETEEIILETSVYARVETLLRGV